jgi:predicted thioesterase
MGRAAELVHLAELAAARLMAPGLRPGESSVTVSTNLHHLALTRMAGRAARAVASTESIEGRLHRFRVEVFDAGGLVATALHTRAVVVPRRVAALARRRAGLPSMLLDP